MKINKSEIKKMILKEMAMLAVRPMEMEGHHDHYHKDHHDHHHMEKTTAPRNQMSKEACCIAIKALAECCECPETKASILNFCDSLM